MGFVERIVPVQRHYMGRGIEGRRKIKNIAYGRGPKGIDRLRVVAHHRQPASVGLHAQQDVRLQPVRVLILVDQHMIPFAANISGQHSNRSSQSSTLCSCLAVT